MGLRNCTAGGSRHECTAGPMPRSARAWSWPLLLAVAMACGGALAADEAKGEADVPMPRLSISERTVEPLLKAERPYEDFTLGYGNVLRIGRQWHLWYEAIDHDFKNDGDRYLCYARSADGVTWERPDLGLYEYQGKRNNNILLYGPAAAGKGGVDGACVFLDEQAPAAERFKMVFSSNPGLSGKGPNEWWVYGGISADGLRWKMLEQPLLKRNSDTHNVCFRDGDRYRMYIRMWSGGLYEGRRQVGYCESKTFGGFASPTVILEPDKQDPADLHFYNSASARLGKDQYVMFPSAYSTGEDAIRGHVAFSRNGQTFRRAGRLPAIDLGKGFDSKSIYVLPGAVPGEKPNTFWIYYIGKGVQHEKNRPGKVRYDGGLGRFLLTVSEQPAP